MDSKKKMLIAGIALVLITMCPPILFLYSAPAMIFGLPRFFVIIEVLTLCIPLMLFLHFRYTYRNK